MTKQNNRTISFLLNGKTITETYDPVGVQLTNNNNFNGHYLVIEDNGFNILKPISYIESSEIIKNIFNKKKVI